MLSRPRSPALRLAGSPIPRPADGALWASLAMIVVTAAMTAIVQWGLQHPGLTPSADLGVRRTIFVINTRIVGPIWVALLVAALLTRRRWPENRLLAHAVAQFYMIVTALYAYALGHYTDLFGAMGLFGGTAIGLLLFDPRIVRAGLLIFAMIIGAVTIAERMQFIPYAPTLLGAQFEAGRLQAGWFYWGAFCFLILLVVAFYFVAATRVARDREQTLRRATALIRRYVPTQLAEKILEGERTASALPERRRVTLFFSDVVGFTEAADQMEPEDLSALLNEYLSEMAAIADSFGATVNQFVGDGIMIFFGAPEATTDQDHALRAVRMALGMQQRMANLRERWFKKGIQTPFCIRVGINTGVASVGDFGSEGRTTYSAIGNQTNLTARIQAHCEPGKVLISHTTWALVKDEIPCLERGEIEVKGLHYPVLVYEVVEAA